MITINNISKSHGVDLLFEKFNSTIDHGEKIGLIGPNGAGKTTLFNIILGEEEPSTGNIRINKGIRIGYLPQEASFGSDITVLAEVLHGDKTIAQLKKEKDFLESEHKADLPRYGEVLHELEFLGYFDLEHRAKKVLAGLGFKESDFNRLISQISGGWQMRALLAKLLTCHYDILLLDEPTNFLDLDAAIWLKDYLHDYKGAFIMISHDKDFLDEVTDYSLILENNTFTKVRGHYEDYQRTQNEKRKHLSKQFKEQERKRKQLETYISRFHAQPNFAAQVRAKKRQLERMPEIIVPLNRRESIRSFHFPQTKQSGYRVIALDKISKAYKDIQVYKDFDFEIIRDEKAVLVGPNGAGKSTLLKILADVVGIDGGNRTLGHNVDIGYFSQTRMDVLNSHNTVLEEAHSVAGGRLTAEDVRTILGAFLFTGDDVNKKVKILSGGEKSRLILAKLLIDPPNFLLLDEPTTHLDVDAVDALIKALTEYKGTLAFISHDIHFVRSVANVVYEINAGRLRKFPGNFDYYWGKHQQQGDIFDSSRDRNKSIKPKQESEKEKRKKKQHLAQEEKKNRKVHNTAVANKIKRLQKQKDNLEIERNVKARILSDSRSYRSEERVKECGRRIKEINEKISKIEKEIVRLNQSFI